LTTDNENALVNVVETPNDDQITETWLSDIVPDEVVNIPKFSLVKKDRPVGRGGGVQVYIRESIETSTRLVK
jgi:hypothetical protein